VNSLIVNLKFPSIITKLLDKSPKAMYFESGENLTLLISL
jgi:hypothetical protein